MRPTACSPPEWTSAGASARSRCSLRRATERILDLCCGTGDVVFHLLRTDPSLHVTGIDFCAPMLDGARARAPREARGDATFIEGDVMALPFADATLRRRDDGF